MYLVVRPRSSMGPVSLLARMYFYFFYSWSVTHSGLREVVVQLSSPSCLEVENYGRVPEEGRTNRVFIEQRVSFALSSSKFESFPFPSTTNP